MIRLITYSNELCTISRMKCAESARKFGADMVYEYEPHNIDTFFKANNEKTLAGERGAGYWLWKPYFINRAIQHCNDGDILVYCDAGVEIITDLNEIVKVMDQDIFLFSNGHQHVHWCKSDVSNAINYWDKVTIEKTNCGQFIGYNSEYDKYQQVQASVIFFKVNDTTRNFIKEWLLWCQMPGFIDDSPSKLPNHPEFAEHRYDQAILTCLAIKYNINLHWWADHLWYESQRYRWPEDKYPSMFKHHRKRNNEY